MYKESLDGIVLRSGLHPPLAMEKMAGLNVTLPLYQKDVFICENPSVPIVSHMYKKYKPCVYLE